MTEVSPLLPPPVDPNPDPQPARVVVSESAPAPAPALMPATESDGIANAAPLDSLMRSAEIAECRLVPWGSNYTFAVTFGPDSGLPEDFIGIYKPRAGEQELWDFPSGTLYHREYAAYLVSQRLAWDFVPPTVIRDGPHGVGSMSAYMEPLNGQSYPQLQREYRWTFLQMALFDLITNNADRKGSHFFAGTDKRLWGIDHGLTFHPHPKLRTVIWDFCGQPIPPQLLDDLIHLYSDDELPDLLRPHLDPLEIEVFRGRIARMVDAGTYPDLNPRRNVPYGW
mgnify:CR=1 FL=1